MTDDLSPFWIHGLAVERLTGTGAYGPTYDTAVTLTGFIDGGQKLVLNAEGQQVVSTATVYLPAATADIPVRSKVTIGAPFEPRTTEVIAVARRDSGALGLPDHLELSLQ